jgi:hypothetical protein
MHGGRRCRHLGHFGVSRRSWMDAHQWATKKGNRLARSHFPATAKQQEESIGWLLSIIIIIIIVLSYIKIRKPTDAFCYTWTKKQKCAS